MGAVQNPGILQNIYALFIARCLPFVEQNHLRKQLNRLTVLTQIKILTNLHGSVILGRFFISPV